MNYFKINYSRLERLKQTSFSIVLWIIGCLIIICMIISIFFKTSKSTLVYGIINSNVLKIKINYELSDVVKNNEYVFINKKKIKYKVDGFGEIDVVGNQIIQNVDLIVDDNFLNNEVVKVIFRYEEKRLIKHILDLFK